VYNGAIVTERRKKAMVNVGVVEHPGAARLNICDGRIEQWQRQDCTLTAMQPKVKVKMLFSLIGQGNAGERPERLVRFGK
jgi:hypothetical protein